MYPSIRAISSVLLHLLKDVSQAFFRKKEIEYLSFIEIEYYVAKWISCYSDRYIRYNN